MILFEKQLTQSKTISIVFEPCSLILGVFKRSYVIWTETLIFIVPCLGICFKHSNYGYIVDRIERREALYKRVSKVVAENPAYTREQLLRDRE